MKHKIQQLPMDPWEAGYVIAEAIDPMTHEALIQGALVERSYLAVKLQEYRAWGTLAVFVILALLGSQLFLIAKLKGWL